MIQHALQGYPDMTLYRHYKQKYYKLHRIVKHSETLDDLVYYECLYDNNGNQFWVRPSELFFGSVDMNGKSVPRFEKVEPKITPTRQITDQDLTRLAPIVEAVLSSHSPNFASKLRSHTVNYLLEATLDDHLVGFKLGYQIDQDSFYSWVGGVLPEYQNFGVASALMKAQHHWCQQAGYKKILTKTANKYKKMLQLNLKFGFDIVGTESSSDGRGLKILMEKKLH